MPFNSEQLPSCLANLFENTNDQGQVLTPGYIKPCWPTCPHFNEAFPLEKLTVGQRQELAERNANGAFMDCQNRRAQAGT